MRKSLSFWSLIFILALLAAMLVPPVSVAEASADMELWTEGDNPDPSWYSPDAKVFKITSAAQLASLAKMVNTENFNTKDMRFEIQNDLYLSGKYWVPIGTKQNPFRGTILSVRNAAENRYCNINDMKIRSDKIDNPNKPENYYFGLIGFAEGYASNASVGLMNISGDIYISSLTDSTGTSSGYVGGAVGYINHGELNQLNVNVSITVTNPTDSSDTKQIWAGGIVGKCEDTSIRCCTFTAAEEGTGQFSVLATNAFVGGLVGEAGARTVIEGNAGNSPQPQNQVPIIVDAVNADVGGLVGKVSGAFSMVEDMSASDGLTHLGRFMWSLADIRVTTRAQTGLANVGGFIGNIEVGNQEIILNELRFARSMRS